MDDDSQNTETTPEAAAELDCQELIRDWGLLFWSFLLFGLGRLVWLYVSGAQTWVFQLGVSCGFLVCGVLGFLMRYVLTPGRIETKGTNYE